MKKFVLSLTVLCAFLSLNAALYAITDLRSKNVVVSISPYKFFIDAIAGDTLQVSLLVPAGTSFHDYEPTPRQMANIANADLWFRVGETFETRAIGALKNHNPRMQIVDLRKDVDLITLQSEGACSHCKQCGADLHIWLSPIQVKIQAKNIEAALTLTYPEHADLYKANLAKLLKDLDDLNFEIKEILLPLKKRTFMVSHSAYAYFARDYHLEQFPIEFDGRDPSPRQLNNILMQARAQQINTIFTQAEHSNKGANLIAKELGAKVVLLAPYTTNDYFGSLRTIAKSIAEQ